MRRDVATFVAAAFLLLAGCGGNAGDQAADSIRAGTADRVEALEEQAANTGNTAAAEKLERAADAAQAHGDAAAAATSTNETPAMVGRAAPQ